MTNLDTIVIGKDIIRERVPSLFTHPATILYVGASPHRSDLVIPLLDVGHKILLLEAYYPNCKHFYGSSTFEWIVYGNVRDIWKDQFPLPIDIAIWWHGPEHVRAGYELEDAVFNLETIAKSLVILACPWGYCPQGDFAGNPYECHVATLYPDNFNKMGYNTETCGEKDKPPNSDLVAWKWVGEQWWKE